MRDFILNILDQIQNEAHDEMKISGDNLDICEVI